MHPHALADSEKTINAAVAPAQASGGVTVVEAGLLSPTVIPV